jgi:VWFA-related protein
MTGRLLAALALVAAAATAQEPPLAVRIVKPTAGIPVYGEVEVAAEVSGAEAVAGVDFTVDGRAVASLARPPFRAVVHVGQDNLAHRFEVSVRGAAGGRATAALTTPAIHVDEEVDVTLQQVFVTVTRDGAPVDDLTIADFEVRDEGVAQRLLTFARGDLPFTAVLLVDASASMRGDKLAAALAGARAFAGGMQPLDEAKLVVFSDRLRSASPFTSFADVLTAGLQRVAAKGGTAIADMLFLAAGRIEERAGRGAIVLLSDGVDTHSALPLRLVAPEVRRSRALVYFLDTSGVDAAGRSGGEPTSPWRDRRGYRDDAELLARLVDGSGGRWLRIASLDEVPTAFAQVVAELRSHYVLGYEPPARRGDGSWRRQRVEVSRPGVDVRCADGYVDR